MTTLIITHKEMDDIMITVESLAESSLFKKGVGETIENKAKEKGWIS